MSIVETPTDREFTNRFIVRGRPPEHYLDVFPEVFLSKGDNARVLIIGPGMSNISLGNKIVGLDPIFKNPSRATLKMDYQGVGSLEVLSTINTKAYLRGLNQKQIQNRHLVAGEASEAIQLPFAYQAFESVVSSNCIFGGLDYVHNSTWLTQAINRIYKHITPSGSLYLYPYFTENPNKEGISLSQIDDFELYYKAFMVQQETLENLKGLDYKIISHVRHTREDKIPTLLSTIRIST